MMGQNRHALKIFVHVTNYHEEFKYSMMKLNVVIALDKFQPSRDALGQITKHCKLSY